MKSRITIEVDFENGQPYIRVINDTTSDDVRDKLVSFFREKFGHTSSWCKMKWESTSFKDGQISLRIDPIRPSEMEAEIEKITEAVRMLKANPEQFAITH